ncbi:alpha/beta fold hydrolase [Nocardioides sp. WS12]|uniref:alpha/beta fold hydrolase n=1 Tax=Nocardioides sp. WS12 TaxID=2486272 RepID=UPI00191EB3D7|nr:alpha/beta fold hydrolase [Nocardioides sp. WS12]
MDIEFTFPSIEVRRHGQHVLVARLCTDLHGLLGRDAARDLALFVKKADRDPSVRAVVLTGSHPERFVGHADLAWLQEDGSVVPPLGRRVMSAVVWLALMLNSNPITRWVARRTPVQGALQLDDMHKTLNLMSTSSTIFVAALNGSALGLGAEIAWACDVRVMADGDYVIGHLEVLLGFAPGAGGTQRLTTLVGPHRARRLMLEGSPLSPAEALRLGVVDEVVPTSEVVQVGVRQAEILAARPQSAIGAIKRSVNAGITRGLRSGLRWERSEFLSSLPQREAQQIMLDYLSDTERDGELPVYRSGGYGSALARGRANGGEPELDPSPAPKLPDSATYGVQTVQFRSGSSWCRAWLYVPHHAGADSPVPVVVMGHGLGATRDLGLAPYAEEFADRGMAALVFTYRGLGDSGGHPRQILSMKRQLQDWDAAIAHAVSLPQLDSERMAIWGSSLGGGHAIATAARHPELAAMVAQCPFTDGVASALALGPGKSMALASPIVRDLVAVARRRPAVMVPIAAVPGGAGLMSTVDALKGMHALVPVGHQWRNEAAARSVLSVLGYRPGRSAHRIAVPSLICISTTDTVAPPKTAERQLRRSPYADVRTYEAGHFAFYVGAAFDQLVTEQAEFLEAHLRPDVRGAPTISASRGSDEQTP